MAKNKEEKLSEKLEEQKIRSEIKVIKNKRKNYIKKLRIENKEAIQEATTDDAKKKLKENFKLVVDHGVVANTEDNIIDVKNLNKYYWTKSQYEHILKDVNLTIKKGDVIIIVGASGSGKSTLLNLLSGLAQPEEGSVIVNGRELYYLNESQLTKFRKDNIAFVFQSYNLIPTLTVLENIKVGYNLRNKEKTPIDLDEVLRLLDLARHSKKYPYQLSGGQNQRISIGRALAKNPEIMFADEPTGALDEERGKEALKLLLDINKKYKTTVIIVSHNPNLKVIGDSTITIKDGRVNKISRNKKREDVMHVKWI